MLGNFERQISPYRANEEEEALNVDLSPRVIRQQGIRTPKLRSRSLILPNRFVEDRAYEYFYGPPGPPTTFPNVLEEVSYSDARELLNRGTLNAIHQNLERSGFMVREFLRGLTGTYQEHSRVDPLAAADYAEEKQNEYKSPLDFAHFPDFSTLGRIIGGAIPALYSGINVFNQAAGNPTFARVLAGGLGTISRLPIVVVGAGLGETAGTYISYRRGEATKGDVWKSAPLALKELISYPTSRFLGRQAIRFYPARYLGRQVLSAGSSLYSSIGRTLNSSWFTSKAGEFSTAATQIESLGKGFLKGDIEAILSSIGAGRGIVTLFQELIDPVIDIGAYFLSRKITRIIGNAVDRRESAKKHSDSIAYSHVGVGEKGPSSRQLADWLGTYKEHSVVDVLKAAVYAAKKGLTSRASRRALTEEVLSIVKNNLGHLDPLQQELYIFALKEHPELAKLEFIPSPSEGVEGFIFTAGKGRKSYIKLGRYDGSAESRINARYTYQSPVYKRLKSRKDLDIYNPEVTNALLLLHELGHAKDFLEKGEKKLSSIFNVDRAELSAKYSYYFSRDVLDKEEQKELLSRIRGLSRSLKDRTAEIPNEAGNITNEILARRSRDIVALVRGKQSADIKLQILYRQQNVEKVADKFAAETMERYLSIVSPAEVAELIARREPLNAMHQNMEKSGSMVREFLHDMTETYKEHSVVDPLKAAVYAAEKGLTLIKARGVLSRELRKVIPESAYKTVLENMKVLFPLQRAVYKTALLDSPELATIPIKKADQYTFFYTPKREESVVFISNKESEIMSKATRVFANRLKRAGIDVSNPENMKVAAFLHELGHAKSYLSMDPWQYENRSKQENIEYLEKFLKYAYRDALTPEENEQFSAALSKLKEEKISQRDFETQSVKIAITFSWGKDFNILDRGRKAAVTKSYILYRNKAQEREADDFALHILTKHFGPGEKGPASRAIVDKLHSYEQHSIVNAIKAATIAELKLAEKSIRYYSKAAKKIYEDIVSKYPVNEREYYNLISSGRIGKTLGRRGVNVRDVEADLMHPLSSVKLSSKDRAFLNKRERATYIFNQKGNVSPEILADRLAFDRTAIITPKIINQQEKAILPALEKRISNIEESSAKDVAINSYPIEEENIVLGNSVTVKSTVKSNVNVIISDADIDMYRLDKELSMKLKRGI